MDALDAPPRRWEGPNPWIVDVGLAAGLATVALVEIARADAVVIPSDTRWSVAFALAITVPLVLRRRYPFAVMAAVGAAATVYNVLDIPPDPYTLTFAVLLAVYSVSAYARQGLAVVAAVVTAVALVVVNLPAFDENDYADIVNQFVLLGGGWVVGQNTRYRWRQAELLRERAARVEREQRERERVAILEERGRLAREIHDVIAHSVGVIAVQAGAARAVAEQRPDRARDALGAIEEVSKDTLVELRRALGALRSADDDASLRPAPGLAVLDELAEQIGRAGVRVSIREEGDRRELPSAVDLSAYRVIQEALTNIVKHSGAAGATVTIRFEPSWLEVLVADEGGVRPSGRGRGGGTGHGLIGMRERVSVLGGEFEAGTAGKGFVVRARFPLTAAEATA
jgi:signal transduction histidine kinase